MVTVVKNKKNYKTILEQGFLPNDRIRIAQYTSATINAGTVTVVASGVQVPSISAYMIPPSGSVSDGFASSTYGQSLDQSSMIIQERLPKVLIDATTNTYKTGSLGTKKEFEDSVIKGLARGQRWFVSFYETLSSPIQYEGPKAITPLVFNSSSLSNGDLIDPLGNYGVREIISASIDAGTTVLHFNLPSNDSNWNGGGAYLGTFGNDPGYGALIWPASEEGVIVRDSTLSGLGAGAFYQEYSNDVITDDFTYISNTYGSNPVA